MVVPATNARGATRGSRGCGPSWVSMEESDAVAPGKSVPSSFGGAVVSGRGPRTAPGGRPVVSSGTTPVITEDANVAPHPEQLDAEADVGWPQRGQCI